MKSAPDWYDSDRIGTLFYPDVQAIAEDAYGAGLRPAGQDARRTALLLVDMQVDFCHREGALHTPGALADIRRVIEFLFRNAEGITQIISSLDTHLPHQIFHPVWWIDAEGRHPPPLTVITLDDVERGRWKPAFDDDWSRSYLQRLEEHAQKQLMVWPYHVPQGGVGHMLDPALWSAVFWHALARDVHPVWWSKGKAPRTEHYSVAGPEVSAPDAPREEQAAAFLDTLDAYDAVLVAGEAASHCVLETLEDLVEAFSDEPGKLAKIHVLEDCTSPVQHPEIDFAAMTRERFEDFKQRGVRFMRSTDPVPGD